MKYRAGFLRFFKKLPGQITGQDSEYAKLRRAAGIVRTTPGSYLDHNGRVRYSINGMIL